MSLTTDQKATKEYKKGLGVADTNTSKRFFEEPVGGRTVLGSAVWSEDTLIPETAPTGLANDEISGVVQRKTDLVLTAVPGSPDSFYHAQLKDAIPFNWGDGSYVYTVKNSLGNVLPAGYNDVEVDNVAGVLRFYGGAPLNSPPSISFFRYIGAKGAGGSQEFGMKYYEFDSGALEEGVTKSVVHNRNMSAYFLMARDPDNNNNVQTNILRPTPGDPLNSVDIQVFAEIPAPGFKIQIAGAGSGNGRFFQFMTGDLEEGVTKTVYHWQNFESYAIMVRDANNNVTVNKIKPSDEDAANAIDIEIYAAIPAPGLTIQVIGI